MKRAARPVMERLMEKVEKTADGCWLFGGYIGKEGFGRIGTGEGATVVRQTHHVTWKSVHGPLRKRQQMTNLCNLQTYP